jgi:hypothetical protein
MNATEGLPVTVRPAYPDDAQALRRLAALDSSSLPAEPLIVAEVEGELRVAVSASDLHAIADPFHPTAHVVEMVRDHIARSARESRPRRRFARRAPALGLRAA